MGAAEGDGGVVSGVSVVDGTDGVVVSVLYLVGCWSVSGCTAGAVLMGLRVVGRRSEMAQFRAVVDACIEGPSGTVILIRGEAGIGTSRTTARRVPR